MGTIRGSRGLTCWSSLALEELHRSGCTEGSSSSGFRSRCLPGARSLISSCQKTSIFSTRQEENIERDWVKSVYIEECCTFRLESYSCETHGMCFWIRFFTWIIFFKISETILWKPSGVTSCLSKANANGFSGLHMAVANLQIDVAQARSNKNCLLL